MGSSTDALLDFVMAMQLEERGKGYHQRGTNLGKKKTIRRKNGFERS